MKNNQSLPEQRRWEQHHLQMAAPCLRTMLERYRRLNEAKDLIAEAAKCIQCQHKMRQEPDNHELHKKIDKLLVEMLDDYNAINSPSCGMMI